MASWPQRQPIADTFRSPRVANEAPLALALGGCISSPRMICCTCMLLFGVVARGELRRDNLDPRRLSLECRQTRRHRRGARQTNHKDA
jgi:hypothetical protein